MTVGPDEIPVVEIPLEDVESDNSRWPPRDEGSDLLPLAESIEEVGLLQPIAVCESASGPQKYDIIVGHRRYQAVKLLGLPTIRALLFPPPQVEGRVGALPFSLRESRVRTQMTEEDLVLAVTYLYDRYGSVQTIADETGLSIDVVRDLLRADRNEDPDTV